MSDRERIISALENCSDPAGKCRDCPYEECERFEKSISEYPDELIRKAVELLKEQEPRVLTHEEADAIAHQTEETAIYLERKSDKSLYAAIAGDTQGRVPNISWLGKERNYQDEYGISWRCWSARPTDEQREAIPWEK